MQDRSALEAAIRASCESARWADAASAALGGYGGELLGFLVALTRDEVEAGEAFSTFSEDMWSALPRFAWHSSFRTWAYTLARHAASRQRRAARRRRSVPLSDEHVAGLVEELRSRTADYLRTESKERFAAVRAKLEPDDQTLLILRVNRGLSYREIAQVLAEPDVALGDDELARRASALRKRMERLKADIKELLRAAEH